MKRPNNPFACQSCGSLFDHDTDCPGYEPAPKTDAEKRAASWWEEAKRSRRYANEQKARADAAEAKLLKLLEELTALGAQYEGRRAEHYADAARARAYGRGISFAADRIRSALGRS